MSKPLLIDWPPTYIYMFRGKTVAGISDQLMKQINHRKVRKSINGGGEGEGVVFGCWKGFNLSHSSGLQSRRRNSANDFHGAKNHLAKIYEGEKKEEKKKKNAARARGKPDYAAWNKTEGSFNARLKAVGSVKLWIPVICIAADCRLNNAQPPFPHFFSNPFSFAVSLFFFFFFFFEPLLFDPTFDATWHVFQASKTRRRIVRTNEIEARTIRLTFKIERFDTTD